MSEWLTLARIIRPQGRRGEVLADLLTDFPEQFAGATPISLSQTNGSRVPATVDGHWMPVGRNAGRIVLKLAGIDTISAAEALAGADIQMPADQRQALEAATYYVTDLIGCAVADGDKEIGLVRDVHFPQDSDGRRLADAAPLFVVERANGDEVLIPFANAFVQRISLEEKRIELLLPNGLLEMNG